MKKIVTFAAAFGLMASMGTAVFADNADSATTTDASSTTPVAESTSETVTEPTKMIPEPIVTANSGVTQPNLPLILTVNTPFYFEPGSQIANMLAPQVVSTTGNRVGSLTGEWVEVYTWLGIAWVHVQ